MAVMLACGGGFPILGGSDAATDVSNDVAPTDAGEAGDATTLACDTTKPFGAPAALVGQDLSTGYEYAPSLSSDELTIWFTSGRNDDASLGTYTHIWSATRPTVASPFGEPVFSSTLNGPSNDSDPWLSADGLTMYFETDRDTGGNNSGNLYVATRASTSTDFSAPTGLTTVNADPGDDIDPALDADGSLWFASDRPPSQGLDIWRAQLAGGTFDTPVQVAELDSSNDDWSATPSADGLTLYFASTRTGGYGANDIWVATRADSTKPFSTPANVAELNTGGDDLPHWLSPDGCRLYLERQVQNTFVMYVATKPK